MDRILTSPRDSFRIGMEFKFITRNNVQLMIYGFANEQDYISSIGSR